MTDLSCDGFSQVGAELALGLADAHERASALAHLERCPRCRADIRQMSDVADALAAMAPPAEPPAGFESRVLERLAASRAPRAGWHPPFRRVLRLGVAASVAGLMGLGGWLLGSASTPAPTIDAGHLVTAKLLASGRPVGDVVVDTDGTPWMAVHLEMHGVGGPMTCAVVTSAGRVVDVGSFQVTGGAGVWSAPLPGGAARLRSAEIVNPAGRVMAVAPLPSAG